MGVGGAASIPPPPSAVSALMASLGFRDGVFHNLLGSKLADMGADKVGALLDRATKGVVFVDECYQLDPKGAAGAAGQKILERIMDHSEEALRVSVAAASSPDVAAPPPASVALRAHVHRHLRGIRGACAGRHSLESGHGEALPTHRRL